MLRRDCLDVYQPDTVCSIGMLGLSRLAREVTAHGKWFTPHTWGNGIGLIANLHLTAGTVGTEAAPTWNSPSTRRNGRPSPRLSTPRPAGHRRRRLADPLRGARLGITLDEQRLRDTRADQASYR